MILSYNTDPALAKSSAFSLDCKLDQTITLTVEGISKLTEIDPSYIFGILSGEIDQPFQSPLDCIYDGLIAISLTINFTKNVAIPNLTSQYVPSTCRCFKF
jgi:hypothetical protein